MSGACLESRLFGTFCDVEEIPHLSPYINTLKLLKSIDTLFPIFVLE
jgi:hypothetical protein